MMGMEKVLISHSSYKISFFFTIHFFNFPSNHKMDSVIWFGSEWMIKIQFFFFLLLFYLFFCQVYRHNAGIQGTATYHTNVFSSLSSSAVLFVMKPLAI